jgi:hypothetical protein
MALEYPLMPDRNDTGSGAEGPGDIFGKLPNERPGVRSPRRRAESKKAGRQPSKAKAVSSRASRDQRAPRPHSPRAEPASTSRRSTPRPSSRAAARPSTSSEQQARVESGGSGIQDVAWAGITVAAEAATLGVRLLGRAVEAVRKPVERP